MHHKQRNEPKVSGLRFKSPKPEAPTAGTSPGGGKKSGKVFRISMKNLPGKNQKEV